jgi:hypothetical protein
VVIAIASAGVDRGRIGVPRWLQLLALDDRATGRREQDGAADGVAADSNFPVVGDAAMNLGLRRSQMARAQRLFRALRIRSGFNGDAHRGRT